MLLFHVLDGSGCQFKTVRCKSRNVHMLHDGKFSSKEKGEGGWVKLIIDTPSATLFISL